MYKNRYYDSSISCSFSDVVDLWAIFASREQDKILAATCWKRNLAEACENGILVIIQSTANQQ